MSVLDQEIQREKTLRNSFLNGLSSDPSQSQIRKISSKHNLKGKTDTQKEIFLNVWHF